MEENLQRSGISREYNEFRDTSIESFGCFVRPLFQLAVVRCLLDDIEDFLGKGFISEGESFRINASHFRIVVEEAALPSRRCDSGKVR